ncbi:MAG: IS701 family transposase [Actinobacteria bacterium]|nr:IS701 family transposase [Actinomycetota bacterium]
MAVIEAARADSAAAVRERLEEFGREVLAEAVSRREQRDNGGLYLRGLIGEGKRKSLEPMVARLGEEADYQSMQQFLTDSPWDPAEVVRAVAERVAAEIEVEAWVLDDTGFPKQGKRSPGVKRQYSGTLGKIGNCQIGVSLHAVAAKGTVPLGWALYLPEEWCSDRQRRAQAKIPDEVTFKTKPELGADLIERAWGWEVPAAPVLGDAAYGDNSELRERLHRGERSYVLGVSAETVALEPGTGFAVPERKGATGRPRDRLRPDRKPVAIGKLIAGFDPSDWQTVAFRDGPEGEPMTSRFAFVRVRAAHRWQRGFTEEPREEWLICEWPEGEEAPTGYWLSNLPAEAEPEWLARLARLRWKIELDYRQLKGELGLDHYEGRSHLGWHHHTALVTAAHGFLTLERLSPFRRWPA